MRQLSMLVPVAVAMATLITSPAQAAVCGSMVLDDAPQEVILGEFGPVYEPPPQPPFGIAPPETILPSGNFGVCWRDADGAWNLEQFSGCDLSSTSDDTFVLYTGGGDDYVAPLLEAQTMPRPGLDWVRAKLLLGGVWTHGMECGSDALAPWNPNFAFGVTAVMGTGADEFHGTPNDDSVESNTTFVDWVRSSPFAPLVPIPRAPGDGSVDLLCGGDGDDELFGDGDDDYVNVGEEYLDGGPGDDFCDGDPPDGLVGPGGGSSSDLATLSCEVVEHAATGAWVDGWFSCEDSANPVDYLGLGA